MAADFTWHDGERTVRFGRGCLTDAVALLGGPGYTLLTTPRAADQAPDLVDAAAVVLEVPGGLVDEIAGDLLDEIDGELIVGLGGGRVIDTAKAVVAARPAQRRAGAVPTTLSAAEMTRVHRHARGVSPTFPKVRPAIVVNDPALSASQPLADLAASAANALAHAVEAPHTTLASPVPTLAAGEAARLIASAYDGDTPDRDALALAALLSGYAIDTAAYGLHHVLAQTLVRVGGLGHGQANAVMLPHTLRRLEPDSPYAETAEDLAIRAGAERLRDLEVTEADLDACADAAAERPELALTPPKADRDEVRALYKSAW